MDFRNVPCLPIHVNARHKPRGLNKMIHDEWNAILSIERLVEYVDSEPKRYRWIHARNFVTESCGRDVFLEINMYVYYVCVFKYVRASSCHFIRFGSVAIIWRRIAIHIWISILICSLHWPFTRLDASYIEFSRSLSLSLSLFFSRCVFFTLITNFDNIREHSANIRMQNTERGLYVFHETNVWIFCQRTDMWKILREKVDKP